MAVPRVGRRINGLPPPRTWQVLEEGAGSESREQQILIEFRKVEKEWLRADTGNRAMAGLQQPLKHAEHLWGGGRDSPLVYRGGPFGILPDAPHPEGDLRPPSTDTALAADSHTPDDMQMVRGGAPVSQAGKQFKTKLNPHAPPFPRPSDSPPVVSHASSTYPPFPYPAFPYPPFFYPHFQYPPFHPPPFYRALTPIPRPTYKQFDLSE